MWHLTSSLVTVEDAIKIASLLVDPGDDSPRTPVVDRNSALAPNFKRVTFFTRPFFNVVKFHREMSLDEIQSATSWLEG